MRPRIRPVRGYSRASREISVCVRLRGGAGRTRTSNQATIPTVSAATAARVNELSDRNSSFSRSPANLYSVSSPDLARQGDKDSGWLIGVCRALPNDPRRAELTARNQARRLPQDGRWLIIGHWMTCEARNFAATLAHSKAKNQDRVGTSPRFCHWPLGDQMFGAANANGSQKTQTVRLAVRNRTDWARTSETLPAARRFAKSRP
jgi:hypothetical protein